MPVFNTRAGLHHLKLGSNTCYTAIHNTVEIYHWSIAYQLHEPEKKTSAKSKNEQKHHEKGKAVVIIKTLYFSNIFLDLTLLFHIFFSSKTAHRERKLWKSERRLWRQKLLLRKLEKILRAQLDLRVDIILHFEIHRRTYLFFLTSRLEITRTKKEYTHTQCHINQSEHKTM